MTQSPGSMPGIPARRIDGKLMSLLLVPHLKPMFHPAEVPVRFREELGVPEESTRISRAARARRRELVCRTGSVRRQQLKRLRDELYFPYSSGSALQVPVERLRSDDLTLGAPLHRRHFGEERRGGGADSEAVQVLKQFGAELEISDNRPRF